MNSPLTFLSFVGFVIYNVYSLGPLSITISRNINILILKTKHTMVLCENPCWKISYLIFYVVLYYKFVLVSINAFFILYVKFPKTMQAMKKGFKPILQGNYLLTRRLTEYFPLSKTGIHTLPKEVITNH